ncbi:hypothetical protein DFH06DRAFT_1122332 [Mycena polygramma]|nr:hypothetical protein DFH06DRAFT_1122332 [Mycena polygramma]
MMSSDTGYESDTGERDNPTPAQVLAGVPVTKTIPVKLGHHTRLLNRKGRAICRIVSPHGRTMTQLAEIFGVGDHGISRALANDYARADDVSKDYDYAPEFKADFLPKIEVIEIIDSDDDTKEGILTSGRSGNGKAAAPSSTVERRHEQAILLVAGQRQGGGFVVPAGSNFNPKEHTGSGWAPSHTLVSRTGDQKFHPTDSYPLRASGSDWDRPALFSAAHQHLPGQKRTYEKSFAYLTQATPRAYEASSSSSETKKPRYAPASSYNEDYSVSIYKTRKLLTFLNPVHSKETRYIYAHVPPLRSNPALAIFECTVYRQNGWHRPGNLQILKQLRSQREADSRLIGSGMIPLPGGTSQLRVLEGTAIAEFLNSFSLSGSGASARSFLSFRQVRDDVRVLWYAITASYFAASFVPAESSESQLPSLPPPLDSPPRSRRVRKAVNEANIVTSTRSRAPTARKRLADDEVSEQPVKKRRVHEVDLLGISSISTSELMVF